MAANDFDTDGRTLCAQLDRLVAQGLGAQGLGAQGLRLILVEKLPDAAFAPWARAKAAREPDEVAWLDLLGDGPNLVTGCIVGLDVAGDDLDEALNVVLTGRSVVLVTGLDRSRAPLGERLFRWLDWSATHVPLTVANTRDAAAFLVRLRHHHVAVDQIVAGRVIQSLHRDP
ncbi:hypothetical protein [Aromatoleum bremense]|nr:hypothetical protein [Aromatoleum bremense]